MNTEGTAIKIENGSFQWSNSSDVPLILKKFVSKTEIFNFQTNHSLYFCSINLKIHQGSLVALVGTVGSGKSSILAALLGEMNKTAGEVNVSGTIAYVPQTAWIFNATLKDNILFGKEFNQILYEQIIEACALKPDFGMIKEDLMERK
jgi:ABC-type multidrug transport system fused ATPase/permease subunit